MEKIKLFAFAFAASMLLFSCQTKTQESNTGTGTNEGMVDNSNDELGEKNEDPSDVAENINDERFKSDSAENQTDFLVEAAQGGLFEVEAAKLAQQKATHSKVRNFAKHMLDDHSKANNELKALAAKRNVTIPSSLDQDKKDKINDLSKLTGGQFDEKYMEIMVKDHKEDVNLFEKQSKGTDDSEVEKWAANIAPKLQKHLEMAQQIKDEVEKENNTSARK